MSAPVRRRRVHSRVIGSARPAASRRRRVDAIELMRRRFEQQRWGARQWPSTGVDRRGSADQLAHHHYRRRQTALARSGRLTSRVTEPRGYRPRASDSGLSERPGVNARALRAGATSMTEACRRAAGVPTDSRSPVIPIEQDSTSKAPFGACIGLSASGSTAVLYLDAHDLSLPYCQFV